MHEVAGLRLTEVLERLDGRAAEDVPAQMLHFRDHGWVVDLDGLAQPALILDRAEVGQIASVPAGFVGGRLGPSPAASEEHLQQIQTVDGGELAQHCVVQEDGLGHWSVPDLVASLQLVAKLRGVDPQETRIWAKGGPLVEVGREEIACEQPRPPRLSRVCRRSCHGFGRTGLSCGLGSGQGLPRVPSHRVDEPEAFETIGEGRRRDHQPQGQRGERWADFEPHAHEVVRRSSNA